jgi:hypothetical protein
MRYIQLVEFDSGHPADEIRRALDDWLAATRGKRTLQTAIVAADHDRSNPRAAKQPDGLCPRAPRDTAQPARGRWSSHELEDASWATGRSLFLRPRRPPGSRRRADEWPTSRRPGP